MAAGRATRKWLIGTAALLVALVVPLCLYYRVSPAVLAAGGGRVVASRVLARLHAEDRVRGDEIRSTYYIGRLPKGGDPSASWRAAEGVFDGFRLLGTEGGKVPAEVPFVYQGMDEPYLAELRAQYRLRRLAGEGEEYQRMLRLFGWVGSRFDHGMDPPPGGNSHFRPLQLLQAAEGGGKFWCEIAAKLTVHAASALGWPARLVTASRDGYTWEHAVAEVWSNQFGKWFAVDCDFNVIYESEGVPLSAYELCHLGPRLAKEGRLTVRRFARDKPSLKRLNLIPYYAYVHIDLRNDWLRRGLERGSPEGGDLATYWTSRPKLSHLLTAKLRVDDGARFDWSVNVAGLSFRGVDRSAQIPALLVEPYAYSPYFSSFAFSIDHGRWIEGSPALLKVPLRKGEHSLRARVVTRAGDLGPPCEIRYRYD